MFAAFTQVWSELVVWFVSLFTDISAIFFTTSAEGVISLTFLGVMAVVTAGVALILLAFNIIRSFVIMRG